MPPVTAETVLQEALQAGIAGHPAVLDG